MINGIHAIVYSKDAERVRAFLANVLDLRSVDAGGGWLIFAAPPTELAVHPTDEEAEHELYLMCDDVKAAVAKLTEHGIKSTSIQDRGWGLVTSVEIADGESVGLYEPRHDSPLHSKQQRKPTTDYDTTEANADLSGARLQYFETYPFPLFSHIDLRVSDADAVRPFYDALMTLFGTEPTTPRVARYGYTRRYGTVRADFLNIFEDPDTHPTLTRIAFAAPSVAFVDEIARIARQFGGQNIEGPQYFEQTHPTFYAVFFEDPLGNRFEVCHHRMDR
jgi:predicted enzyme related to lactoylglutathione lyase